MTDVKYEIKKTIGIISEGKKGWKKELNFISWNDKEAKYDMRDWNEDHSKMGKGITFTKDEALKLVELLEREK